MHAASQGAAGVPQGKYRFLLFDADMTLLDFPADMEKAFHSMYAQHFQTQRPMSREILACYNACNDRAWRRFEQGLCKKEELYIDRFVDFFKETGLCGDARKVNETYFSGMAETGTLLPGAAELIKELYGRYELYIITNGNVVSQQPRLEHAGLAQYFKEVFVSEAVGVGKPHKEYFDYVMSHIPGFVKEQALVIGDSLASDIQGAVNAGLDSIWYCPAFDEAAPGEAAPLYSYRAESYSEILYILAHV